MTLKGWPTGSGQGRRGRRRATKGKATKCRHSDLRDQCGRVHRNLVVGRLGQCLPRRRTVQPHCRLFGSFGLKCGCAVRMNGPCCGLSWPPVRHRRMLFLVSSQYQLPRRRHRSCSVPAHLWPLAHSSLRSPPDVHGPYTTMVPAACKAVGSRNLATPKEELS